MSRIRSEGFGRTNPNARPLPVRDLEPAGLIVPPVPRLTILPRVCRTVVLGPGVDTQIAVQDGSREWLWIGPPLSDAAVFAHPGTAVSQCGLTTYRTGEPLMFRREDWGDIVCQDWWATVVEIGLSAIHTVMIQEGYRA